MPKRQFGERDFVRTAKRRRRRQRHLYLVFDDWSRGYSIRKVNLPSGSGADEERRRVPHAFWRFVAERRWPQFFKSAFGPNILAMHPVRFGDPVQVIDVRARVVMPGPVGTVPCFPIYIPVGGDKLLALDLSTSDLCRWPPLEQPAAPHATAQYDGYESYDDDGDRPLSWRPIPDRPFGIIDVSSYAVHSDERTVLVSTRSGGGGGGGAAATFALDTEALVWKKHGEWAMPFNGRGHFVRGLNAFVGLSKDAEGRGYLYSCDATMISAGDVGSGLCPPPAWKRSKEKVYNNNPDEERHAGTTLVYMGQCKFCLIECVSIDGDGPDDDHDDGQMMLEEPEGEPQEHGRYVYRLMTFSLRYDGMGEMRVERYRVCCYDVPSKATTHQFVDGDPVAFWL
ncbi:unnamed protein product [Urochloa humidicola]